MSSVSHENKKTLEYPHFQIYYDLWVQSLKKPADLLVLFFHYLLIHNRFKCIDDDDKETDYLPSVWNSSKNFYEIMYRKRGTNYWLVTHLEDDSIYLNLKRMSDSMDTLQYMNVSDYTNVDDYNNPNYHISYRNLDHFYHKTQWSINTIKQKATSSSDSISSNYHSTSSMSSITSATNLMSLSTKRNEPRISNLILAQIKKEKTSMDDELEADRQQRMITLQKEREKKEAERLRQLNAKATKMLNTKPTKLYDYNPITNYYRYNAGVNHDLNLDASNCLNDQFYKESFEKFNLKPARLSVIDCLKDGLLKDVKIPVILTKYMKEKLNLNKSKNPPVNSTVNKKQKRKRRGSHQSEAPIPNVGKRHKITTEQNTEATTQQKLSAASTICMDVNNDIKRDTVSIQEENGAVSLLENIEKYLKNQNTKVELLPEEKTFLNEQSDNLNKSSSHHVDASIIDEKVVKNTNSNWLTDLMNKKATPKKSTTQGLLPPEENKENSEDKEMCIDESFTNFVSTQQTNYERVMNSETPTDKAKDPLSQIIPKSKTKQATLIFGGGSDMSFTFGSLDGHDVTAGPTKNNSATKK